MAEAKNAVLENPETVAEAHVESSQDQRAQSVGAVALSEANSRQRRRSVRRLKTLQFDCARLSPSLHGRSSRCAKTLVARENVWQALFVKHREPLLQAAQKIRGRRIGEIEPGIGLEHRPPVPIAADQLRRP